MLSPRPLGSAVTNSPSRARTLAHERPEPPASHGTVTSAAGMRLLVLSSACVGVWWVSASRIRPARTVPEPGARERSEAEDGEPVAGRGVLLIDEGVRADGKDVTADGLAELRAPALDQRDDVGGIECRAYSIVRTLLGATKTEEAGGGAVLDVRPSTHQPQRLIGIELICRITILL